MIVQDSQHELENLVQMAESVSATIEDLNTKITNLRSMAMVSLVGIYASIGSGAILWKSSAIFENLDYWAFLIICFATLTLITGASYFLFQYFKKIKYLRYKLEREKDVLLHLLTLVSEYKDNIYENNYSYVERALIDIRLKRIGYSAKW
ncbi:hypothetical protein [Aeromonas veronii]